MFKRLSRFSGPNFMTINLRIKRMVKNSLQFIP